MIRQENMTRIENNNLFLVLKIKVAHHIIPLRQTLGVRINDEMRCRDREMSPS